MSPLQEPEFRPADSEQDVIACFVPHVDRSADRVISQCVMIAPVTVTHGVSFPTRQPASFFKITKIRQIQ